MYQDLFDEAMCLLKAGAAELVVDTDEQVWTKEVYRIFEMDSDYRPTINSVIGLFNPTHKDLLLDAVQRAIACGAPFDGEVQLLTPKGNLRWLHEKWEARRIEGKTKKIFCVLQDITQRKWLEEDGRTMTAQLEQILKAGGIESGKAFSEIVSIQDRLASPLSIFSQKGRIDHPFGQILGQSPVLKDVLWRVEKVAPTDATVLIVGETGTGKDLIANAIHQASARRNKPMVTVNCAALPANLLESELFGREKGAYTGADTRRLGRFETADGSTICLDEIGEMSLELQAKLLRVIQYNEFERLGSSQTIRADVRIVATTNRKLAEEVRQGRFREDLYYRLNVFPIAVPPLRLRKEDIPILVQAFTERCARKLGKEITSIHRNAMQDLQEYPWPGNIRELESVIERAVILCQGPVLQLIDRLDTVSFPLPPVGSTLRDAERHQIHKALSETGWRIEGKQGAAAVLGLHPSTLRARMKKLLIRRPAAEDMN